MNPTVTPAIAKNLLSNDGPFSIEEDASAESEGWNIFSTEDIEKPYRLEKIDELSLLKTDAEAWLLVASKAKSGSPLHVKAMAFLESFSPSEYADILNYESSASIDEAN